MKTNQLIILALSTIIISCTKNQNESGMITYEIIVDAPNTVTFEEITFHDTVYWSEKAESKTITNFTGNEWTYSVDYTDFETFDGQGNFMSGSGCIGFEILHEPDTFSATWRIYKDGQLIFDSTNNSSQDFIGNYFMDENDCASWYEQ